MTLATNRVVIGAAKQTAKGSPVAPTVFPRWQDGTDVQPDLKTELIREGDGTPTIGRVIKNLQFWKGKVHHGKARAIDSAWFLARLFGTNSDRTSGYGITGTAGTKTGTMGALVAGATTGTYTLTGGAAPVVGDIIQIDVNNTSTPTTAELVKLTAVSGAGPYTLTWAATDALLFAHAAAAPATNVVAPFTHTFQPVNTRDYCTLYQQYLLSTPEALQIQDCFVHSGKISGAAGKIIDFEYDYVGLLANDYTTAITASYDASSAPFIYYGGTFNVDGATTGATAPWLKAVNFDYKYPVDESQQTEAVTLADIISTLREVSLSLEVLFQDFSQFKKTYFGSTVGTTDAATVGTGSVDITWLAGGSDINNSIELKIPNLVYTAANLGTPMLDGKAMVQKISAVGTGGAGNPEMTAILKCGQYSAG